MALYGTEDLCRAAVAAWRWPDGFVCPACGGTEHCIVGPRQLYQCNACRRQTSLTVGTIFNSTKVPLTTWFRAMYLITQTKQGISSIELGRRLGTTQTTAWKIKTKLAEVMRARRRKDQAFGPHRDGHAGGVLSARCLPRRREGRRALPAAGKQMDGPRHIWWNFVSSSKERIDQAKAEWKSGRFDTVPGDAEEFIPLPE